MPVLLVAVSDDETRGSVVAALERRYGADYDVLGVAGASALPAALDALADDGQDLAFALVPISEAGAVSLAEVPDRFPAARRIALVEVGNTAFAAALSQALTLNTVDYYVGHPWTTAEEELYPVTTEALRVWARDKQLHFDKATIVDAPDGHRGMALASWLSRNTVATSFHTTTSSAGAALIAGPLAGVGLPAVLLYDGSVLGDPADDELAEALGARTHPSLDHYDVTIVGAGPAGLAAAVYAAAEGMRTLVIEKYAVGGQAGTSTKIRNYLGFRWGISGRDLTVEASRQAEQLGGDFVITRAATALTVDGDDRIVTLANGDAVRSASVIVATGVAYRQLQVAAVDRLVGRGVFYGAGASEIAVMAGRRVCVLGAGNSAGQAACALAAAGAAVTILVRGADLGASMSDYLVQQVTATPNITVRTESTVVDAQGQQRLEGLTVETAGRPVVVEADGLFVFIGARPHTEWLVDSLVLDDNGFVLTGADLPSDVPRAWLEASVPGVFAAGDIRHGSIKRVAAAVGEGSTAAMLALDRLDR